MEFPIKGSRVSNMKTEIFSLKGHCKKFSLHYFVFVFCILVATHNKDESDLQRYKNNLH